MLTGTKTITVNLLRLLFKLSSIDLDPTSFTSLVLQSLRLTSGYYSYYSLFLSITDDLSIRKGLMYGPQLGR